MDKKLPNVEGIDLKLSKETLKYIPLHKKISGNNTNFASKYSSILLISKKLIEENKIYNITIKKLKKQVMDSSMTIDAYKKKADYHRKVAFRFALINKQLEAENHRLARLLDKMKKQLSNKEIIHEQEKISYEQQSNDKIKNIMKKSLEKELQLSTQCESLKEVLDRYYNTLKTEREYNEKKKQELKDHFLQLLK